MTDLHVFAFMIVLIAFFVSMAIDKYLFGAVVILLSIALALENEIVTLICAGISVFWVGSALKDTWGKGR